MFEWFHWVASYLGEKGAAFVIGAVIVGLLEFGIYIQYSDAQRTIDDRMTYVLEAVDAETFAARIDVVLDDLDERGLTDGTMGVFYRESTDLHLVRGNLIAYQNEAVLLAEYNHDSLYYQDGFNRLREQVKGLAYTPSKLVLKRSVLWYMIAIVVVVTAGAVTAFEANERLARRRFEFRFGTH